MPSSGPSCAVAPTQNPRVAHTLFFFFSYSTLIFCWFLPFFTTGIRNPGSPRTWRKFACTGPGGGIDGEPVSRFAGVVGAYEKSPTVLPLRHYVWTEKRRYAVGGGCPPTALFLSLGVLWTEEAPLSRGRGCPPTALLLTGVLWAGHVFGHVGRFQRSRGEPIELVNHHDLLVGKLRHLTT